MKKKIQKPFNLEAWKNGAKVETRDGREVRILCTDAKNDTGSIVGLVKIDPTREEIKEWKDETIEKQYINREGDEIDCGITFSKYYFLAFHNAKQRNLFLAENERLIKNYLMID